MIQDTESQLFDFLVEIMREKNFNVYRGFLPKNRTEDRARYNTKTNEYFPFIMLRVLNFSQVREGFHNYDCFAEFEIWIGTKEEEKEDYINNLAIGDYIRQQLMEESMRNGSFAIDQTKKFNVEFYSDQVEPYYYSRVSFTVFAEPIESNIKAYL